MGRGHCVAVSVNPAHEGGTGLSRCSGKGVSAVILNGVCIVLNVAVHERNIVSLSFKLSVEGHVSAAHGAYCGIPTGEGVAGLGRICRCDDLLALCIGINVAVGCAVNKECCLILRILNEYCGVSYIGSTHGLREGNNVSAVK